MAHLVTLLTDFGTADPYVGEVKGILHSVPGVTIVDLTHNIPAFEIRWAAFQLLRAYRSFPKGTWHIAVVDPGVGTSRRAIYVKTKHFHFVGPDNGVLRWAIEDAEKREGGAAKRFEIIVPESVSPTFHARDVFAPFVARSLGKNAGKGIKAISEIKGESFPKSQAIATGARGEILGSDHFGNVVTSVFHEVHSDAKAAVIDGMSVQILPYANYEMIPAGKCGLIRGSHGLWEIATAKGSAWERLKLTGREKLTVLFAESPAPKTRNSRARKRR